MEDEDDYDYDEFDDYDEEEDFFDDELDDEDRERIEMSKLKQTEDLRSEMERIRADGTCLFRCVNMRDGKIIHREMGDICSASYKSGPYGRYKESWKAGDVFGLIYNGEKGASGTCRSPKGMLNGGEKSLAWLKFLLDPDQSPWAEVIPAVSNRDEIEWINEKGGFIFTNFDQIGANVFGGFVIATRFAQEHPDDSDDWFNYVKDGMNPRLAYILANTIDSKNNSRRSPCGHHPQSGLSEVWMKNFWVRKGTLGPSVAPNGFSGGDSLYGGAGSPEYQAFYGYDAKKSENSKLTGKTVPEMLEQIKERIGYSE